MPSTISQFLASLNCFKRTPPVTIGTPISYSFESKEPKVSAKSIDSVDRNSSTEKSVSLVVTESILQPPQKLGHSQEKPRTNRALVVADKGRYEIRDSYPFPTLNHEREVIISTSAVGLNPIDWKSVDYGFCLPEFPWITGREMAGVVEHVGSDVTDFHVGQRVWTSTYYKDCRAGCFQDFVTVPHHTVLPIPDGLSFEEASCLGVAGLTAAMALWRWLQVPGSPMPDTDVHAHTLPGSGYLLIWGGSTITAQFAIQLAVQGGLRVIAVTSSKTKPVATSLGATHVVTRDGKTGEEIVAEIRSIAGDGITRAIDLVGTATAALCLAALSQSQPALFAPLAMMSSKTTVPDNVAVQTVEMKQFVLDPTCRPYAVALNKLVQERKIVLPRIEVLEGGLDVVLEGLERVKKGDMAGRKLIVSMS